MSVATESPQKSYVVEPDFRSYDRTEDPSENIRLFSISELKLVAVRYTSSRIVAHRGQPAEKLTLD